MRSGINLPTISGLMIPQAEKIAELYLQSKDWNECRKEAIEKNIMQIDKTASSKRYVSYVISLLRRLSEEEIMILAGDSQEDRKAMMWLSFCRAYPLIGEFASTVIHQKFISHEFSLTPNDWSEFLAGKAQENEGIDEIGKATRTKAKTVIFTNLRQAELLSSSNELKEARLSEDAMKAIKKDLAFFPSFTTGDVK